MCPTHTPQGHTHTLNAHTHSICMCPNLNASNTAKSPHLALH